MLINDSNFTTQIRSLLSRLHGRSHVKDSLLDRAICFYATYENNKAKELRLTEELNELANKVGNSKNSTKAIQKQKELKEKYLNDFKLQLLDERLIRQNHLNLLCEEVISLVETESFTETNRRSAQLLGTIQLISPSEGKKVAQNNEQCKGLYKAVLALRLFDHLAINPKVAHPLISQYLSSEALEKVSDLSVTHPEIYNPIIKQIKSAIVMAALLQDIGNYHPEAQAILLGQDGKQNPYRVLPIEERKTLLQINFRETNRFLIEGIGGGCYTGNVKTEKTAFDKNERFKLALIKQLLKSSIQPKQGIGNLLKVPQIYTSIILSTKESYNYKVLPNVYQVLNQNAELGSCSQEYVDALYVITGMFPQGYGVTYIPSEQDGTPSDCYEYAIVNRLYPTVPEQPLCRMATRKLTFIGYGHEIEVTKQRNLYFKQTAKKLSGMSRERLNEILELLASNYTERQTLDLLPRCWFAKEYFALKNNQKLWNKITT